VQKAVLSTKNTNFLLDWCALFLVLKSIHSSFSPSIQLRSSSPTVGGVDKPSLTHQDQSFCERFTSYSGCCELCEFRRRRLFGFSVYDRFSCLNVSKSVPLCRQVSTRLGHEGNPSSISYCWGRDLDVENLYEPCFVRKEPRASR